MTKPRAPRIVRHTGTEVHKDRRTRRRRQRGQEKRAVIADGLRVVSGDFGGTAIPPRENEE